MPEKRSGRPLIIGIIILVAILGWFFGIQPMIDESAAREAMQKTVDACGISQAEVAHRYVEAQAAIRKLPAEKGYELSQELDKSLDYIMCR